MALRFFRHARPSMAPLVWGTVTVVNSLAVNVASNLFASGLLFRVLLIASVLTALMTLVVTMRQRPIRARLGTPRVIRTASDAQQLARRGLIGFVSLYQPQAGSPLLGRPPEEWLAAANPPQLAILDLDHSNLAPLLQSILAHKQKLEHCWLIATKGHAPGTSSSTYVAAVKAYFRAKRMTPTFYAGPDYSVDIAHDEALVPEKTMRMVEGIFASADRIGLGPNEIVADITPCPRSMALGMTWACLDGSRDVQFMGTRYGPDGKTVGVSVPIIYDFEPTHDEAR